MPLPEILTLPRLHEIAAPVYLAFLLAEYFLVQKGIAAGRFRREDTHTSLIMGIGSIVSALFVGALGVGVVLWAYENRIATIGFAWWAFALCFVLDDLRFYWGHRISHRSRWFWAAHVVHHSSEHYNFSTALRQPWTGQITGLVLLATPLAYLGFHPALIAFCASANLVYQFFLHTESVGRLHPWIEAVFNTPSHHRVHHASNPRYLDANYAGTLSADYEKIFALIKNRNPEQATAQHAMWKNALGLKRAFVAVGGLLLAGPDPTGGGRVLPSFGNHRAQELLVNASTYRGIATHTGTIAPGKLLATVKGRYGQY